MVFAHFSACNCFVPSGTNTVCVKTIATEHQVLSGMSDTEWERVADPNGEHGGIGQEDTLEELEAQLKALEAEGAGEGTDCSQASGGAALSLPLMRCRPCLLLVTALAGATGQYCEDRQTPNFKVDAYG